MTSGIYSARSMMRPASLRSLVATRRLYAQRACPSMRPGGTGGRVRQPRYWCYGRSGKPFLLSRKPQTYDLLQIDSVVIPSRQSDPRQGFRRAWLRERPGTNLCCVPGRCLIGHLLRVRAAPGIKCSRRSLRRAYVPICPHSLLTLLSVYMFDMVAKCVRLLRLYS
eukprot:scaffold3597_cov395-Prasinococcus_capsulatus_cf.AAC.8